MRNRPALGSEQKVHVRLERASLQHEAEFLAAVRRSGRLHGRWVKPPSSAERFREYLKRQDSTTNIAYFAFSDADDLVGVVNVSEIVRGPFQSAYLGYYGFARHQRRGYMTAALTAVVSASFSKHRLHRLEANIQPANSSSIALVKRLGFRKEGYSKRYLRIGGQWCDHERWAITREDWTRRRKPRLNAR